MSSQEPQSFLPETMANWRVKPRADPNFRAIVWERISARSQVASFGHYVRAHGSLVASAFAIALLLGGWVGREQARTRVSHDRAEIASAYVQALDARTMPMR